MQHVYQHVRFLVALFWNCNIQNNTLLRQRGRLSIGDFVPVFVSYNQLNLKDDQNLIVITHCYGIFERGGVISTDNVLQQWFSVPLHLF